VFLLQYALLKNILNNLYTVTCRHISRQSPKYAHATIEKVLQEVVRVMPIARQRIAKHISTEANAKQRSQYADSNRITSVAMQRTVNTTIDEEVFLCGSCIYIYITGQRICFVWVRLETI
jgi:hypothetical protein